MAKSSAELFELCLDASLSEEACNMRQWEHLVSNNERGAMEEVHNAQEYAITAGVLWRLFKAS